MPATLTLSWWMIIALVGFFLIGIFRMSECTGLHGEVQLHFFPSILPIFLFVFVCAVTIIAEVKTA